MNDSTPKMPPPATVYHCPEHGHIWIQEAGHEGTLPCDQCIRDLPPVEYVPASDSAELRKALEAVVEALEDAIAHNVNATDYDPAGWTQEDYDSWEAARKLGEAALKAEAA